MTAQEANRIAVSQKHTLNEFLTRIYTGIVNEAQKGELSTSFDLDQIRVDTLENVIKTLKENGYDISLTYLDGRARYRLGVSWYMIKE